jgi:hypothetical protein
MWESCDMAKEVRKGGARGETCFRKQGSTRDDELPSVTTFSADISWSAYRYCCLCVSRQLIGSMVVAPGVVSLPLGHPLAVFNG